MSNRASSLLMLVFASMFLVSLGMISHNAFADQVIGNIPTGPVPVSVGVNPQTNMIYVANFGWFGHYYPNCNNTITVINGSTNSVVSTITVGHCPISVGINPNTNRIYIVNQNDNTTSVIDGSTNSVVSTISVGQPSDDAYTNLAVNPATDKIYVTTHAGVVVIDGSTNQVVDTIHVGDQYCPEVDHVAVNPDTGRIYVTNLCYHKSFDRLVVVDGSTDTVIDTITVGELLSADLAVNPATNKIYVAKEPVTVIDGSTDTVTGTIDTFADRGIAVNPTTNKVYVLSVFDNSTSIIDGSMDILTGTISGFDIPWGVAVNPVTNRVYVTNEGNDTVSVIKSSKPEGIILENLKSTSGTTSSSNHLTLPSFKAGTLGNQLLLVGVSANNNNVTSVTFGGVPLTRAAYSFYNNDAEFWYLTNPSGTGNIVATFFGPTQAVMGAYSFANVNQTDPIPTHAAGTDKQSTGSPTMYLTTKYPNDLMIDLPSIWGGVTLWPFYDSDCTEKWDINVPDEITGASSLELVPVPAYAYCDWTASSGDRWDDVAVEVRSTAPAPSAPQNLVATAGSSQVALSWAAPASNGGSAITNYKIYSSMGIEAEDLLAEIGNVTAYTDNTATSGHTYYYRVTAVNSAGESALSNEANATLAVPATIPSAPQNLAVTGGSAKVDLSWSAPSSNGGSAITKYQAYRGTSSESETLLGTIGNVTSYTDNTVTNGQAYFYKVTAVNSAGESALSNEASATPHTSSDEVIDTIPVGNYPSYIAVYPNTNRIYVSDGNDTKVIDGATDAVVGAIPVHPIQMAINPTTNLIYALAGSGQTVYVINGTTNAIVNTIPLNQTMGSIVVNPNTNKIYEATSYGLYVYVVDGTTNDIIKIIQLPGSIEGLAINPQTNKIYVSHYMSNVLSVIDGSTDTHVGDVGVDSRALSVGVNPLTNIIYLSTRGSGANPNTYVINGSTNSVITIIPHFVTAEFGINPATNKIYMATGNSPNSVSVINGSTNSVIQSMTVGYDPNGIGVNPDTNRIYVSNYLASSVSVIAGSSSSGTTPATIAPSTPQSLVATAGNAQVSLSWTSPKNNGGSAITGYNVYRGTSTGGESFLALVSADTTSYTDTAVANGATYYYDIAAVNSVGTSIPSNEAHATPATPATVSSAPTALKATTASSSQINLNWTAPANNGGSQVTGYMIQRSTDSGTTWSTIASNTGSTATKYNNTGLSPSTTYTYQVSAINSAGTSAPSNTASATTNAVIARGIVLNNVQSTSGTTDSSNQITLSNFNAAAGNDRLLVVGVSANSNNVGSITFAGVPLAREVSHFTNNDAEFWYLTNPTGTGDITVTMNGPTQAVVGAYSFSGVNQTAPIPAHITRHNLTPSSPAISITTSHPNDWVLDLPSIWGGVTLGFPTCTQQWNVNVAGQITGASSSTMVQSPATVTCSWTASSDNMWDDAAIELKAG